MVSLQASLFREERKESPKPEKPSKKRKWEGGGGGGGEAHIELNLETPLPLEWQRCLDIKSGQIHFYNTRTHKRTCRDPRRSPEPLSPLPTLDLELNLTCEPSAGGRCNYTDSASAAAATLGGGGLPCSPSPAASLDVDRREMVAAVCTRCHMLVMMCKAAPSCPNCKFVHPPAHSSQQQAIKPGFRLLCCED